MIAPEHAEWMARLVDFNLRVARYTDRSWYPDGLCDALCDAKGRIEARAERALSAWLLGEHGLRRQMDWRMAEPQKRIWLLDRESLDGLTRDLSLAMHRDRFAQTIDGSRLRHLHEKVGERSWRFAVEEVPAGLFRHRSSAVDFENGTVDAIEAGLRRDGACTLLALLDSAWSAVQGRAQLHLHHSLARRTVPALGPARAEKVLELICKHIVPGRFPQWAWLF